ncbi:thioredoxin domain-containing protein [Nocardia huaxiensis]|uniref:thioredoxin domain-containing protein n=1 Tax=Nocardia huaxiensis TaxID=2755382 RepID=UPI001FD1EC54|nr:thioredoxin domain-containing protein [Nocardia huaxiensis]
MGPRFVTTKGVVSAQVSSKPGDRKNPLAKADQADRNRKILIQVGVAAVLIGLVVAIGVGVMNKKSDKDGQAIDANWNSEAAAAVPPNLTDSGAIRIENASANPPEGSKKVTVQLVADLQCPACEMFEQANSDALTKAVQSGSAAVEYNIISFLNQVSNGNLYSQRAAAAAYVVATADRSKFQDWVTKMFAAQPAEGSDGMTEDKLLEITKSAGYTDPAVEKDIKEGKYTSWVMDHTKSVFATGIKSTPTVYVNGQQIQPPMTKDGMTAVIESAAKG